MHGHESFLHGFTFGGHPMACAVAHGEPRRLRERGDPRARPRERGRVRATMLESLRDIPIVGDVRGMGYFRAIELVKDRETKADASTTTESEWLLRGFLSGELYRRGLICRADDRGDPVIQLAPPLIATPSSSARSTTSCARCSRRRRAGLAPLVGSVLTVRELLAGLDVTRPRRRGRPRRAGALGAHLRAPRPDAVAVGRRAPAHDGDAARRRRRAARVRRAARRPRPRRASASGTGFAHDTVPAAMVQAADARGFPLFEVPYELPFIAVTERAFAAWSTSSTSCCGARSPRRSACSASSCSERGPRAIAGALAASLGAAVARARRARRAARAATFRRALPREHLRDRRREIRERGGEAEARGFVPADPELAARALALPVAATARARRTGPRRPGSSASRTPARTPSSTG